MWAFFEMALALRERGDRDVRWSKQCFQQQIIPSDVNQVNIDGYGCASRLFHMTKGWTSLTRSIYVMWVAILSKLYVSRFRLTSNIMCSVVAEGQYVVNATAV